MALPKVDGTKVRGDTYHLNLRIPVSLQARYDGKTHLRGSLRTSDHKVAAQAVMLARAKFVEEGRDAERRADLGVLVAGLRPDQRTLFEEAGGTLEGLLDALELSKEGLAFAAVGSSDYDSDMPVTPLERRLEEARDRVAYAELESQAVQEAKVLAALGEKVALPGSAFGLVELAANYFDDKGTDQQTREAYGYVVRRFIEFHGDVALDDLTTAHLREYASAVSGLPAVTSSKKMRGLPFKDAVAVAAAEGLKTIGEATRAKHISMLKALTAYAVPQGYMSSDPWAQYKLVKAKRKHSAREKPRAPFAPSDARRIIKYAALEYAEATIDRWAPILACYQGARREEIGQLMGNDIFEENGVWAMRITDEGEAQKLKNEASLRTIPLHPEVVASGFVDFAKGRVGGEFLFREAERWGGKLEPMRPDNRGRVSEGYGKRFSRMLRTKLAIKDRRLVFHSFRHLWEDAAENAEIPQTHRRDLAGRTKAGDSQAIYGDGPRLAALLKSLSKIDPLS